MRRFIADIGFRDKCNQTDKPIAALLKDLRALGMPEDTLVVGGGELLGFDHYEMSVPFKGLNQKLTGVKPATVIEDALT